MKEVISISTSVLPNYGEILMGIGCLIKENRDTLFENECAKEEIKDYLESITAKVKSIQDIQRDEMFQRIIYEYSGRVILFGAIKDTQTEEKIVNIRLYDFFVKAIWPILIKAYIEKLSYDNKYIVVPIKIKKDILVKIYGEYNSNNFFNEFKSFLLCNYITICEALILDNDDLLIKLMIPQPPSQRV